MPVGGRVLLRVCHRVRVPVQHQSAATKPTPSSGIVTASGTPIVHNTAVTAGGGIYNGSGGTITLTNSPVLYNKPDNCEPPGSITGCTG